MQVVEDPLSLRLLLGYFSMDLKNQTFNWRFLVRLWQMTDKKMPWLYQTISKTFESYGYAGLTYNCNPGTTVVTDARCNYPTTVAVPVPAATTT